MLNVWCGTGRLYAIPELRKTTTGISVTSFDIANDTGWGEKKKTNSITITAFGKTAEFASRFFQKGQLIAVNGSLQTRTYEDKEGKKRKVYEVIADQLHFAESKAKTQPAMANTTQYNAGDADGFMVIDESTSDLPF